VNASTHSMTADERLDEMIIESFPASDPPPYWTGDSRIVPQPESLAGGVDAVDIRTKRVYERAETSDGYRILIAAQWAYPKRQSIAFIGDGGFIMLMGEFLTAARYSLPIKVFVCNNGVLGQILWEQILLGYPEHGVRFQQSADLAPWALACGGFGVRVDKPADLPAAVDEALAHPGPALVDVVVNPDEPPMPATITYDQAKGFAQAFLRGQPRRASIASTLFRDKIEQLKS
jgi:pyruvate dehydrogenase (quinone)